MLELASDCSKWQQFNVLQAVTERRDVTQKSISWSARCKFSQRGGATAAGLQSEDVRMAD